MFILKHYEVPYLSYYVVSYNLTNNVLNLAAYSASLKNMQHNIHKISNQNCGQYTVH